MTATATLIGTVQVKLIASNGHKWLGIASTGEYWFGFYAGQSHPLYAPGTAVAHYAIADRLEAACRLAEIRGKDITTDD